MGGLNWAEGMKMYFGEYEPTPGQVARLYTAALKLSKPTINHRKYCQNRTMDDRAFGYQHGRRDRFRYERFKGAQCDLENDCASNKFKIVQTEARKARYKIKKSGLTAETAALLWRRWINVDEESRWTLKFQQDE